MIVSSKWLASVVMAGALTLGVTVSNAQGQTRGIRVQGGMMAMAFRPNPFMVRPMPFRPSPCVRPIRPTILADLGKLITEQSANDMQASALSLPDEVIAHINVNHGTGNIALLKRKGDLPWPAALNGPEDADLRAQFAAQARAVVQRAQKEGQIDADLIAEMTRGGEQLKKLLPRIARSQTPDSYV